MLVCTDNSEAVTYINHQEGLRSRRMSQLAHHHLLWSQMVDLFASLKSSHCQLYYSLTEAPLGTDALAHSWTRALRRYVFPPVSLLAHTLCKVREDEEQDLLVAPYWPNRTWFPELMLLETAPPSCIPLRKEYSTIWHPRPDLWNLHVWQKRQTLVACHRLC